MASCDIGSTISIYPGDAAIWRAFFDLMEERVMDCV
jgi:hypothetical protein